MVSEYCQLHIRDQYHQMKFYEQAKEAHVFVVEC